MTSHLNESLSLVGGKIIGRCLHQLLPHEDILFVIPGGPGIEGHYIDELAAALGIQLGINAVVVDLPNHGLSAFPLEEGPVDYHKATHILSSAIEELSNKNTGNIMLLGHSLGAHHVFSILGNTPVPIPLAIFISFPSTFDFSSEFKRKVEKIYSVDPVIKTEDDFKVYWRGILPLYFYGAVSSSFFDLMTHRTQNFTNEGYLDNFPAFSTILEKFQSLAKKPQVVIVDGAHDIVASDGNLDTLRSAFPYADFSTVTNSGHFPMLENLDETLSLIVRKISAAKSSTP